MRQMKTIGTVIGLLVGIGLPLYLLWSLTVSVERGTLEAWAIVATLLLVPVFFVGFWFGKTEVRGFLAGIDAALDKMALSVEKIDKTVERKARRDQPNFNVFIPGQGNAYLPPISHRQLTSEEEVIDL